MPQVHFVRMRRSEFLDLNDALQHPGRKIQAEVSLSFEQEEDIDLMSPVEGEIEAVSTGNVLLLEGRFRCKTVLECARCSNPLETDLEFELKEEFPVDGIASAYSRSDMAKVAADDEPYPLFDGNKLIVEALVRQAYWVSIPAQPLCSFGWDGPCPLAAGADQALDVQGEIPEWQRSLKSIKIEE
ncbi:MAG: YceD family protein [Fimbriimonadaceae bacterium]